MAELPQDGVFEVAVAFPLAAPPPASRHRDGAAHDGLHAGQRVEGHLFGPTGSGRETRRLANLVRRDGTGIEQFKAAAEAGRRHIDLNPPPQRFFTDRALRSVGVDLEPLGMLPGSQLEQPSSGPVGAEEVRDATVGREGKPGQSVGPQPIPDRCAGFVLAGETYLAPSPAHGPASVHDTRTGAVAQIAQTDQINSPCPALLDFLAIDEADQTDQMKRIADGLTRLGLADQTDQMKSRWLMADS